MKTTVKLSALVVIILLIAILSWGSSDNNSGSTSDNASTPQNDHLSDTYRWIEVEGFHVEVNFPNNLDADSADDLTFSINLLGRQLRRVKGVLPPLAVSQLQTRVLFYLSDRCDRGGEVYYWYSDDRDENDKIGWVILDCFKYVKNILEDAFYGGEEVEGQRVNGNPGLILHELAHGWHDIFVEDGFDNDMIEQFYDDGLSCLANEDENDPYYWETDPEEFFAEFTVMYYLSHWDKPSFVWEMPQRFRILIQRVWNEVEYVDWEDYVTDCN